MTRSIRDIESRENTVKSTRESEARAHEMVEEYNMEYTSPLTIPHGVKKEDHEYYWATTNIRGQPVYEVERLCAKKWDLVPKDRAPNYAHDPLQRNPYCGQYIATKDGILMERHKRYSEMERAAFHHMNTTKIKSLRGVRDSFGNASSDGAFTSNRINSF